MKKQLYLILSHHIDTDSVYNTLVGAYKSMNAAIVSMRGAIWEDFECVKEWWEEDDCDEMEIEEQYQEWIEENYTDEKLELWSFTDDDPMEHTYAIRTVEVDDDCKGKMHALLCTRIDGIENKTDVVGIYSTKKLATEALEKLEANEVENEIDIYYSVKEFKL